MTDGKPLERDVISLDQPVGEVVREAEAGHSSSHDLSLAGSSATKSALPPEVLEQMTADIIAALKTVYDPEIPSDIYELGLIYKVDISDERHVSVEMTLTAPGCPVAGEMPTWVENAVSAVPGVQSCSVTLTFDPPWDQSRMSDEARLALNMF